MISSDKDLAASWLLQGKVAAIPTETVYGLAALANNSQAIQQVFTLKKRPLNHPLILHIGKDWDISSWASEIPAYAYALMNRFWPGPLTLVFKKSSMVNPIITASQDSVAIRCPNHPLTLKLLEKLQVPLVAPSANLFGKISPTTALHVQHQFPMEDLLILEGGRCKVGIESTIVDVRDLNHYQILRPGIINQETIEQVIDTARHSKNSDLRISGNLKHHYQPQKPLYSFNDKQDLLSFIQKNPSFYLLSFSKINIHHPCFNLPNCPSKAAYELYYQLRVADDSSADAIVIELPPKNSHWDFIRERLIKASFQVV